MEKCNKQHKTSHKSQTKVFGKILNSIQKYNKWVTILEKMISIGEWLSLEEYSKDNLNANIHLRRDLCYTYIFYLIVNFLGQLYIKKVKKRPYMSGLVVTKMT